MTARPDVTSADSLHLSFYEREVLPFVRPFTEALVASLPTFDRAPRLFDHGAGTGEVLDGIRRATAVSRAVLLDPSPAMTERMRARFPGDPTVEIVESRVGDVLDREGDNPFSSRFDLVTSQLALMFVDDPPAEL